MREALRQGRPLATACAAIATALAALLLAPAYRDLAWLLPTWLAIAGVAVTGFAVRAIRAPAPLHGIVEVLVLVVMLTGMFARDAAALGLLPGPAAANALRSMVGAGLDDVTAYVAPAPATSGLVLLAVGGIGLVAVLVDVMGVTLRLPALAGIPLLTVYAIPASVVRGGAPWFVFPAAAAGWLLLMAADQRDGVRSWSTSGAPTLPTVARGAIGLGAIALVAAVAVPAAVPGLAEPVWGTGRGGGPLLDGGSGGDGPVRIDPFASLRRSILASDDRVVLEYSSPASRPSYLRLVALDYFDGVVWRDGLPGDSATDQRIPITAALEEPAGQSRARDTRDIRVVELDNPRLPLPFAAVGIEALDRDTAERLDSGAWSWEPDSRTAVSDGDPAGGMAYRVSVVDAEPSPSQLRAAGTGNAPASLRDNLGIPGGLPESAVAIADAILAKHDTAYDRAVALQDYFTTDGGFRYSTAVESDPAQGFLQQFLADRIGYCQQFAGSMAVIARLMGIPSRVVIGFSPGEQRDDGAWSVTVRDAHAWPELWFNGVGWVRFEPTPRADGGSGVAPPAYAPGTSSPDSDTASSARPARPESAPGRPLLEAPTPLTAPTADADPGDSLRRWGILVTAIAALLALLAPAGVRLARRRARRRGGAEAAWDEVRDSVRDLGLPWDDSDTPRAAGARLVAAGAATGAVAEVVRATEQERYAGRVATAEPTVAGVRQIRSTMGAQAGLAARVRSWLWPRSVVSRRREP